MYWIVQGQSKGLRRKVNSSSLKEILLEDIDFPYIHRIIEWFGLEGTLKDNQVQPHIT